MTHVTGTIAHLQICAAHRAPMQPQPSLRAIADLGLEGDLHARQGNARQVLFMDEETLAAFGLSAGSVRENITTRGIELKTLAPGMRLRASGAVFEITQPCSPCDLIEDIRPGLRAAMEGQRGVLARVVEGGELRVGDGISVETV
jgi:MOSC domain-containing protein YiiM